MALKWFRLSAEQGNIGAKTNLGWMHDYGYGVPQDRKEAIRLYRHSAELGNIYAQYNLGIINDNGGCEVYLFFLFVRSSRNIFYFIHIFFFSISPSKYLI
jgi:TPR repeat protein